MAVKSNESVEKLKSGSRYQGDWAWLDLVAAGIGFVEHLRLRSSHLERCEHVHAHERAGLVKRAHRALLEIRRNL
jgi:hypothetical protein